MVTQIVANPKAKGLSHPNKSPATGVVTKTIVGYTKTVRDRNRH